MGFELQPKQVEALKLLASGKKHVMLFGGSRSGKTFFLVRAVLSRALQAAGSRHCIVRRVTATCKQAIGMDTLPRVMHLCFPQVSYNYNRTEGYVTLPNGATIWLVGMDDEQRAEKILGFEFSTIYINEASELSLRNRDLLLTRLAQNAYRQDGSLLMLRVFYDCNPPDDGHWTYALFVRGSDPITGLPLRNPDDYAALLINPNDNPLLSPDYIATLEAMPEYMRRRFLLGQYSAQNPDALFNSVDIQAWRVDDIERQYRRVVIGVDPSGNGGDGDATGIVVVGLGYDGYAYVMADYTTAGNPSMWGKAVANAYEVYGAHLVVYEGNFGGEMVGAVIRAANPRIQCKKVTASRGKHVRAEPVSALYSQGRVRHVGYYRELEQELMGFSNKGYLGDKSPNRADALIWGVTEVMAGVIAGAMSQAPTVVPESLDRWL